MKVIQALDQAGIQYMITGVDFWILTAEPFDQSHWAKKLNVESLWKQLTDEAEIA